MCPVAPGPCPIPGLPAGLAGVLHPKHACVSASPCPRCRCCRRVTSATVAARGPLSASPCSISRSCLRTAGALRVSPGKQGAASAGPCGMAALEPRPCRGQDTHLLLCWRRLMKHHFSVTKESTEFSQSNINQTSAASRALFPLTISQNKAEAIALISASHETPSDWEKLESSSFGARATCFHPPNLSGG